MGKKLETQIDKFPSGNKCIGWTRLASKEVCEDKQQSYHSDKEYISCAGQERELHEL